MTTKTATVYTLDIPGWRPALANELFAVHWAKRGRLKKRDTERVGIAAAAEGVPLVRWPRSVETGAKALGVDMGSRSDTPKPRRRRVRATIYGPHYNHPKRRPDPDAPLKSLLDALVSAGLLVDDSERWCDWEKPAFAKGPTRTVITLEDFEDE